MLVGLDEYVLDQDVTQSKLIFMLLNLTVESCVEETCLHSLQGLNQEFIRGSG